MLVNDFIFQFGLDELSNEWAWKHTNAMQHSPSRHKTQFKVVNKMTSACMRRYFIVALNEASI